jgi:hypothetical protein
MQDRAPRDAGAIDSVIRRNTKSIEQWELHGRFTSAESSIVEPKSVRRSARVEGSIANAADSPSHRRQSGSVDSPAYGDRFSLDRGARLKEQVPADDNEVAVYRGGNGRIAANDDRRP